MINYGRQRTPMFLDGTIADFGTNCANCAEHIGGYHTPYLQALVHGEDVVVCDSICLGELERVWAPSHRRLPWREVVRAVALGIAFYYLSL